MEKKDFNSNNEPKGAAGKHPRRPRIGQRPASSSRTARRDDEGNSYQPQRDNAHRPSRFNGSRDGESRPNRFSDNARPESKPQRQFRSNDGETNAERPAGTGRRNHHGKSHATRRPGQHSKSQPTTQEGAQTRVKRQPPAPKPKTPPPTPKPYDGTTRLNKYIANAGICSRREADKLIAAGSVSVNGKVVTEMGFQVHEGDVVNYGGETLHSERKRYFLLNKPKGFITTLDDPQERDTVMTLIDGACKERIYPVGRLDRNTTGLLLFTNDGDLARRLTHPSTGVYKIYQVELDKPVTREDMRQMLEGIELEDGPIHVDDVQYVATANDKRVVGVELHSGKNRIVRRIFEHFGYNVHKLDRVVFAGLTKKDLPRGRYRELSVKEVGFLQMI